jgi:uncharacterized protein (DUF2062 family)
MLFGRRYRLPTWKRVRELIWPRAGIRRAAKYVAHRVRRLPGTPSSIAAGFACGAAVSFTPFIGLHFIMGAGLAVLMGGNVIASAIGTTVGNPWTFPFIWSWIFTLGRWILGQGDGAALPADLSLTWIFDHPWEVLYPMVIGGLPTAIVAWFIFFWPCYKAVQRYQASRRARRERGARLRQLRRQRKMAAYKTKGEG